jgi:hypothetical protein
MIDIKKDENEKKDERPDVKETKGEIVKKTEELLKQADKDDLELLSKIGNLYHVINKPGYLDVDSLKNAVDSLSEFSKIQEYDYLHNLLVPERCKGVKIPSPIPVPSCAFQMHNSVTLSTNSTGNMCAVFNPYFLGNSSNGYFHVPAGSVPNPSGGDVAYPATDLYPSYFTTLWFNNDDSLDGNSINDNFLPMNIGQCIPPVYDQYRVVSASVVVRYIGRLDNASGLICGAVVFDENQNIGAHTEAADGTSAGVTKNHDLAKYGNFELARDSFYHQEYMSVEGLRMLYFPVDNSFEEYVKTFDVSVGEYSLNPQYGNTWGNGSLKASQDYYKAGFNFCLYSINAPPDTACFKVDIYVNFECLPNSSFLNYLPLSMNAKGISSQEKAKANLIVQQKPIMKANEGTDKATMIRMPSIWEKLKSKFAGKLPGIAAMFGKGLLTALSGWKTGVAISNALGSFMGSGGIGGMDLDF